MRYGCLALISIFLLGLGVGGWYVFQMRNQPPEWVLEKVTEGAIRQTISATGSLAAVTTVEVGCQISGIIASIAVDFNDRVREGQLIAQLDSSTYEAQLEQATANLESARSNEQNSLSQIENLRASIHGIKADEEVGTANLRKAEVAVTDAERNFKRMKELVERRLVSQSEFDAAESALDGQKAGFQAAKSQMNTYKAKMNSVNAQISSAEAQHHGALSQIRQMEALVRVARINLERTRIYSPIDGVVVSRKVDVGQTVAASLQAPTLFTIAKDLRRMQIETDVDEADIGQVKEGQSASFTVDTFKGRTFKGTVMQVRLSPSVSSNVVTYSVMVMVDNDDLVLLPGMTANVEILVNDREKIIRLPSRALLFKPSAAFMPAGLPPLPEGTEHAYVWGLSPASRPVPIKVRMGIFDDRHTELVEGDLKPGQKLLVGDNSAQRAKSRDPGPPPPL